MSECGFDGCDKEALVRSPFGFGGGKHLVLSEKPLIVTQGLNWIFLCHGHAVDFAVDHQNSLFFEMDPA